MVKKKLTEPKWLEHLARQASSPHSKVAYCAVHDLSLNAFRYWKKRCAKEARQKNQELLEVAPPWPANVQDLCAISFPNGCTVRLRTSDSAGLVAALAKAFGLS